MSVLTFDKVKEFFYINKTESNHLAIMTIKIALIGRPNVGKSTFLNSLLQTGKKAKTGNLPGVTRQMQYINSENYDLLDSPGVLPVKVHIKSAYKLALCEIIPNKFFDEEVLEKEIMELLQDKHLNITPKEALRKFRQGKIKANLDI